MEEQVNISTLNLQQQIPFLNDFYRGINGYIILAIAIGGVLFLLNFGVFLHTIGEIYKIIRKQYQSRTLLLCAIYPIVSAAAFVTILIPKSVLICHTVMHISFTICAVIFFQLCFAYVDGEENFLKHTNPDALNIKTPPLCCCCICFPPMAPTKVRLCIVRYMIFQLPIFQFLIMLALNAIYIYEQDIYSDALIYFVPFMIASILIGLWGLNIVTKMISIALPDHNLKLKYICVQLVLVICKLQPVILENILKWIKFGGKYPITDTVYIQDIVQLVILTEMSILSFVAKKVYKKPTHL